MKTMKLVGLAIAMIAVTACGSQKAALKNDSYFTAKEREKYNQSHQKASTSTDLDSREDNFSRSHQAYDEDYCYSCRVRRYSAGVWYDPWWGSGWGWRSWYGPGWGYSYGWGSGWGPVWDPYWGWRPAYAGPGWYYAPGWGWSYYAGPGWWMAPSGGSPSTPRSNYQPRNYTTPSGNTTYRPPRNTVITPGGTPPRRSAAPPSTGSRPSYSPTAPANTGGARPSIQSGGTRGGGVRSSSPSGGARPR